MSSAATSGSVASTDSVGTGVVGGARRGGRRMLLNPGVQSLGGAGYRRLDWGEEGVGGMRPVVSLPTPPTEGEGAGAGAGAETGPRVLSREDREVQLRDAVMQMQISDLQP